MPPENQRYKTVPITNLTGNFDLLRNKLKSAEGVLSGSTRKKHTALSPAEAKANRKLQAKRQQLKSLSHKKQNEAKIIQLQPCLAKQNEQIRVKESNVNDDDEFCLSSDKLSSLRPSLKPRFKDCFKLVEGAIDTPRCYENYRRASTELMQFDEKKSASTSNNQQVAFWQLTMPKSK